MIVRPLVIDDAAKATIARVAAYATDPDNLYRPGPTAQIPGNDPNMVAQLGTYRFVFSITEIDGVTFRHLTASIPEDRLYPNPVAVFMVAELFGFTGWSEEHSSVPAKTWHTDYDKEKGFVSVVQRIEQTQ